MCVRWLLIATALLSSGIAVSLTTDVIPKSDLRKRAVMVPIAAAWSPSNPVKTADFVTRFRDDRILLRGRDATGHSWSASLPPSGRGIWRTGIGARRTYYVVGYTGGSGIAPQTWIFAFSFDAQGRPLPFFVSSYSEYDANGLKDLLNLDGTGPQLIQQDWCDTHWDRSQVGMQSGLWLTTLYEQRNGYWYRNDGRHGLRTFPLYEKWSRWSPAQPRLVNNEDVPSRCTTNHGNDPATGMQATISHVDGYGFQSKVDPECARFVASVVVRDSDRGREIEVEDPQAGPLLQAIASAHRPVVLTGMSKSMLPDHCEVAVVWDTQN